MPWNPNVPNVINRVQDDLAAMRENFHHLDPLAQAVDELQAVSGLASVAGELQAVSELAPYIQAILGSRIVDHNLDVSNPPNGYYVRFENGLQVCWNVLGGPRSTATATGPLYRDDAATTWTFPAAFIASLRVYGTVLRSTDDDFRLFFAPHAITTTSVTYRDVATASSTSLGRFDQLLALGRWK